jgi:hypothetical protein
LVTDRVQMSLPNVTASAASVAASGAPPGRPAVAMLAIVVAVTAWRLLALIWTGHDLQPDEAQYWLWAQEPAFGYFSKPPMVAWLIGATTAACGDGEACVRLGSPLLHGMAALAIWRLGQEIGGPRLGLWSGTLYLTLPGIGFSSLLVSTDVPLLLCSRRVRACSRNTRWPICCSARWSGWRSRLRRRDGSASPRPW